MAKNGNYGATNRPHAQNDPVGVKSGTSEKMKISDSLEQLGMHAVGPDQKPGANPKKKVAGGHILN